MTRVDHLRDAVARWEPRLGALLDVDPATLDRAAAALAAASGPLAGLVFGVKDVIDVEGAPTRNGSAACAAAAPARRDASVVASLRGAGATCLCKTATTEFAFTDPTPTQNPFDPSRTPGGSSSGSGAAVGAGILDFALGTQTAGSLIRPAAYCGAVGFKPGRGALSTAGMTPLAPSFDMIGFIARDVATAAAAFAACGGAAPERSDLSRLRLGLPATDPATALAESVAGSIAGAAAALRDAGSSVKALAPAVDFAATIADHRTVMQAEAAAAHGARLAGAPLGPAFTEALRAGATVGAAERAETLGRLAATRDRFWRDSAGYDLLLAPPVPAPAPPRAAGTGYQHMLTVWTVFGGPLLCLPWGADEAGLPLSVMLAAPPGKEAALLGAGLVLERFAPPRPIPPSARG
ncbi:MAG: amidase family protein [Pikeienuella sp.]|uniref:amidase family protein n=1 Tax=Pikeienuella sp. TaxID=2831957 RepID=UPI00391AA0AD